ncbi:two-component system sensor histidine kinase AtoS [Brenneria goodwinii]|uniref:two-component system sensor histidine kinase AtoS n=1 Tax=Brenneria goodwinii TaxID=1109412 RepID=UPI0036F02B74
MIRSGISIVFNKTNPPLSPKIITALCALFPHTLRNKMIFLAVFMVFLPVLIMAYIVEVQGKEALLREKEKKLYAVTQLLDDVLGDKLEQFADLPRSERIHALNQHLSATTDKITRTFLNVGAGYYSKSLDAIITYAPQEQYGNTVGASISAEHPGRQVMLTGKPLIKSGFQVRGDIMNAMMPIIRHGEIIGYIWANELSNDINKQAMAMDISIITVITIGLMISLFLIISFSRRLTRDVDLIESGLSQLPVDLKAQLPPLHGEMGRIAASINTLSRDLREVRTLNELIIESAADGVISIDNYGKITMCNPAAQEISGYSNEELIGKHYKSVFDKEGFQSPVLDTLTHGVGHVGVELDYPAKEKILQIKASSSQLRNAEGEIIGALVIFTDLTAQKQMQKQIERAERLATLGELMAGVAHEVRNPLTAISGFVQYLKEGERDRQRVEYINIILKEVRSINNVIQQLLDFARPHSRLYQCIAINPLIRETLLLVHTHGLDNRVDFTITLDETLPDIEADAELLKQVILNLMINAVQAIPARGEINVSTRRYGDDKLQIKIRDSGIGIAPDVMEKIFTPFFTTKPTGTGLGLSIAQRIITAHNGDITIESQPQHGTTVTLILPILKCSRSAQ